MRQAPRYRMLGVIVLGSASILSGCASTLEAGAEHGQLRKTNPRVHREHVMQAAWRGRPYHSLLEQLGPPKVVMTHPGVRFDRGEIVLYGVRDINSKCIDAFTVVGPGSQQDRVVVDYFCR